jgi:hypothetical protein
MYKYLHPSEDVEDRPLLVTCLPQCKECSCVHELWHGHSRYTEPEHAMYPKFKMAVKENGLHCLIPTPGGSSVAVCCSSDGAHLVEELGVWHVENGGYSHGGAISENKSDERLWEMDAWSHHAETLKRHGFNKQ